MNRGLQSKLLFYLVTRQFAQPLSPFDSDELCDRVYRRGGYAVEHVLTYSGAVPQVPYNQHLGLPLAGMLLREQDSQGHGSLGMAEQNDKQNAARQSEIRQIVEDAVAQSLQAQIPKLQSHLQAEIVQQVLEAMPPQTSDIPAATHSNSGALVYAVSSIHAGSTQKEILRALLDAASEYCSRIALFVVKAGAASGWQSRGFGEDEAVKDFSLDLSAGPVSHTYQNRIATPGNIAEMGSRFVQQFGAPSNEQVLVLPLALKDKVAALVYADGGDSGKLDPSALELLVITTSAWLEVTSLRKQAASKEEVGSSRIETAGPPVATVSSYSDPFAAHAPKHIPAEPEPAAEVVEVASAHAASAAAAPAAAADPLAGLAPEDAETHRKAQRFARLLVDEIKLYNQAKVAEGRRNKDLYDRLKEDIDKSRGTFQKRYGSTAAASGDYFHHELLRSLAEDDISIMGSNFHR